MLNVDVTFLQLNKRFYPKMNKEVTQTMATTEDTTDYFYYQIILWIFFVSNPQNSFYFLLEKREILPSKKLEPVKV